jgi:hypothetical protein
MAFVRTYTTLITAALSTEPATTNIIVYDVQSGAYFVAATLGVLDTTFSTSFFGLPSITTATLSPGSSSTFTSVSTATSRPLSICPSSLTTISAKSPTLSPTSPPNPQSPPNNAGKIAAGVITPILVFAIAVGIFLYLCKKTKSQLDAAEPAQPANRESPALPELRDHGDSTLALLKMAAWLGDRKQKR